MKSNYIKSLIINSLCLFLLLFNSCQTNKKIDWLLLYENMKANNTLLSIDINKVQPAILKSAAKYSQFIRLHEKSVLVSEKVNTIQGVIGSIKSDICTDLEITTPLENTASVFKNTHTVQTILFKNKRLYELRDSFEALRTLLISSIEERDHAYFDNETHKISILKPVNIETFKNSTVERTIFELERLNNILLQSELAIANYLFGQTGVDEMWHPYFRPVSNPVKRTVKQGEYFETKIHLHGLRELQKLKMWVNGQQIYIKDNQGGYRIKTTEAGYQTYTAKVQLINPITDSLETYEQEFNYYVSE